MKLIICVWLIQYVMSLSQINWLIDTEFTAGQYHIILQGNIYSVGYPKNPINGGNYTYVQLYNKAVKIIPTIILGMTSISYLSVQGAIGVSNTISNIGLSSFSTNITLYSNNSIQLFTYQYLAYQQNFTYLATTYYVYNMNILNQGTGYRIQTVDISLPAKFSFTNQTYFFKFICNFYIDNNGSNYNITADLDYLNSSAITIIFSTGGNTSIVNTSVYITAYDIYYNNQTFYGRFFYQPVYGTNGVRSNLTTTNIWPAFNYRAFMIGMNSVNFLGSGNLTFDIRQDYISIIGTYLYVQFDAFEFLLLGCINGSDIYYVPELDMCNNSCVPPLQPNYYKFCQICSYTCQMCVNPTVCYSCNSSYHRTLVPNGILGGSCICDDGYYDDGINKMCALCSYECLTCIINSTNCLTCNTITRIFFSNSCPCISGTYDNGITICSSCYSSCLTCNGGSISNCLTCNISAFRTLSNHTCICQPSYYENTISFTCVACHYSCYACVDSTTCTSCDLNSRIKNNTGCNCVSGYYDDGIHYYCIKCYYACGNCYNNPTNCTSCNSSSNRILINNSCLCLNGYADIAQQTCIANSTLSCSYTCQVCNNPFSCLSCSISSNRVYNSNNSLCSCTSGYYDDGLNQLCLETCGDGINLSSNTSRCDDNNTINGDGCSSVCQVQQNFTCLNNKNLLSVCIYSQSLTLNVTQMTKLSYSNQINIVISVSPQIYQLALLDYTQVITITGITDFTASYNYSSGFIYIIVNYTNDIENSAINVLFNPNLVSRAFKVGTSYKFTLKSTNNQPAVMYSDSTYNNAQKINTYAQIIQYSSLIVFLNSFFFNRLIGIEFIGIVQLSYISISYVKNIPPVLAPYINMSYINGPNILKNTNMQPSFINEINLLGYEIDFINNFNVMFLILIFSPLILGLSYSLVMKFKQYDSQQIKLICTAITLESFLNMFLFNFYQIVFSTIIYIKYNSIDSGTNRSLNIVQLFFIWVLFGVLITLLKFKTQYFPHTIKPFKQDILSQNHFIFIMIYRFIMAILIATLNQTSAISYVILIVPIVSLIYKFWKMPYIDIFQNIRQIINECVTLLILGYYSSININPNQITQTNFAMYFPYVNSSLLILIIFINGASIFKSINFKLKSQYLKKDVEVIRNKARIHTQQSFGNNNDTIIKQQGMNNLNFNHQQNNVKINQ